MLDNHMTLNNKDPQPLKCPHCGELATGKSVNEIPWGKEIEIKGIVYVVGVDYGLGGNREVLIETVYECDCGCTFDEYGRVIK